jgi:serine-type D-Ala-D-Ala carboxypeptidase (penicillin-binding protein 5/6)
MKSVKLALIYSFLMSVICTAQESYVVFDSVSGKVFYANLTENQRPVASLTKIATAKLVLDWTTLTNTNLDTQIRVPQTAALGGANPLSLQAGDVLTIRDALYASLLSSDNVSAYALANYVGAFLNQKRNLNVDPVEGFVGEMNRMAKALNMNNTQFYNPHGLDEQTSNFSSATDIALLSLAAMNDQAFAFMVNQKTRKVSVRKASGESLQYSLQNTNELLGKNGIIGVKTGQTAAAGQCLVTVASKQAMITEEPNGEKRIRPRQLVIVLLGSNNRFEQTSTLLEAGWAAYENWGVQGFLIPGNGVGLLKLPEKPAAEAPNAQLQP